MPFPSFGAIRRRPASLAGLLLLAVHIAPVAAHEGHDHGAPPVVATASSSEPRAALTSELYEAVAVRRNGRLVVHIDRFATNEPVVDAKVTVALGGEEEILAEPAQDGTYSVQSPKLEGSGALEIVLSVSSPAGDDLLIGTIELPARATAPIAADPGAVATIEIAGRRIAASYALAGAAALGLLVGLAVRGRRRVVAMSLAVAVAAAGTPETLRAHEGHDHGAEASRSSAQPSGDRPERLPDGGVFLPKASQRILDVRTVMTKSGEAERTISLIGRVIADPNRSGIVQSANGGRVGPPDGGQLPRLGSTVRRGDALAVVEPSIISADRATLAERVGDIEQQTALAEARLARAKRLVASGSGTTVAVSDAEIEVEGLRRRREAVREIRSAPEILRAPVDGVLAANRVVAGQVVAAQDILFQIVDPASLFVEATVFHEADMPSIAGEASATTTYIDGPPLRLRHLGASRTMQQHSVAVQFAIIAPPPGLSVGQPVTVVAPSGKREAGIVLPREAVVRGGNGETLVWRHATPERFEPRLVRVEPLDAGRVVVRAGLKEGERVVVRGADLVNQIR